MMFISIRRMSPVVFLCLAGGVVFYFFDQYYVHNTLWGMQPILKIVAALETRIRLILH
ncbi:MAG: hypothetical protein NUV65_06200 [Candidatus Roizmanbacteria bacterium]|nr:hypothetical protein [Candidatus Roizmanbacteria bacterium]